MRDKEKQRANAARHYRNNVAVMKAKAKVHNAETTIVIKAYIADYLTSHPCVDCGETDPIVLEFDHLDRATKRANVSQMVYKGHSLETVKVEIDKCNVRCANCHRRRTHRQRIEEGGNLTKATTIAPLPLFDGII